MDDLPLGIIQENVTEILQALPHGMLLVTLQKQERQKK